MEGHPVTIRTLDPPLHEFLPDQEDITAKLAKLDKEDEDYDEKVEEMHKILARIDELKEMNPMLGHRGCRLGIVYPEITEMQVRAIMEAACELTKSGKKVYPEIMIPLVGHVNELRNQADVVNRVAIEVMDRYKTKVNYLVGTMIEIPRAAVTADEIAGVAQFFSFGTNDLTQMSMGFSRDDAGKFLKYYTNKGILPKDPFVSLDIEGVGQLVRMGFEKGRATNEELKVGICGEHGGDPASIEFCHEVGLNYVSCSPYRVPIARLVAAQAALRDKDQLAKPDKKRVQARKAAAAKKAKATKARKTTKAKKTATKSTAKKSPAKKTTTAKVTSIKEPAKKKTVKKAAAKKPGAKSKK
jgi:pyruvate,orthophosphate dikinase